MKITLLVTGKTDQHFLKEGIDLYYRRLIHYCDFSVIEIPNMKKAKNIGKEQRKILEGEKILSKVNPEKELHLFDEHGINYSSEEFAEFIEKKMLSGTKELIFVVGGPYGFSNEVYRKAVSRISLSRMTFSHQLARLLCIEQIYRAFTIIRGEPYHNA
jgi:23S rRNA (pseudouridine1915-N3)-methyltransferase